MRKSYFIPIVFVGLLLLSATQLSAQVDIENSKIGALTAIIGLLMDETPGGPVALGFDEANSSSYGYNYGSGNYKEELDIHFESQVAATVICFNGVDVSVGEVQIELNGLHVGELQAGNNCLTFELADLLEGDNVLKFIHTNPGGRWGINSLFYDYDRDYWLTLPKLVDIEWNNVAVRKVLQVFAFGGHATDSQIQVWADMNPEAAIKEMLHFSPYNEKLSPVPNGEKYPPPPSLVVATLDNNLALPGPFWRFREYMGDLNSTLPIPLDANNYVRRGLDVDQYDAQGAWVRMTTARGFNPFRQKIGYWETNYHMAVNLETAVTNRQLTKYYDVIMQAHAQAQDQGLSYKHVIATAAKSAAVAFQYGHHENVWTTNPDTGELYCRCNEDFAREIHQLFFGILGEQDPLGLAHHENVTIPETAKALTDMRVEWDNVNERFPEYVTFETDDHHSGYVDVLNTQISGVDAAAKIDAISDVAIDHPESLETLPVLIISGLADDDLSPAEKQQLRTAWASMPTKSFLEFIQAYAVSKLFHAESRYKYFSSIDRFLYLANKLVLNNTEALIDRYRIGSSSASSRGFVTESVSIFRPLHNVFGGQTGEEASNSAAVMENNYNRFTDDEYRQRSSRCNDCDNGGEWLKDWGAVIPKVGGVHKVEDIALWLWKHFVGDGGKNYRQVERAHMLALMGTNRDLNQLYCVLKRREAEGILPSTSDIQNNLSPLHIILNDKPSSTRRCETGFSAEELTLLEYGFTDADLEEPELAALIVEMGNATLALDSTVDDEKENANEEIGQGINFILTTPFIMAQESR